MTALTATEAEVEHLDAAETILVSGWRYLLERGQSPDFVAALIAAAIDYEPRLGLPMDVCERHGCPVLVDETARTHAGLYCSPECEDGDAQHQWEIRDGAFRGRSA